MITVNNEVLKNDGSDLPMFSRAGKFTTSQYLVFSKEMNSHYPKEKIDEEDDGDNFFDDKKPTDVEFEMKKIQQTEQLEKFRQTKHSLSIQNTNRRQGSFVPFDLPVKEGKKKLSSSFLATEREAWQQAHANKTNPPDGLKFRPKYEVIWELPKTFNIHKPQPNIGQKRILEKQWQHSYLCDRVTKTLNDE